MEWLPAIGVILGGLGAILAVFATFRGQSETKQTSQLALAWEMQEKQLDMLVKDKDDCLVRIRESEQKIYELRKDLADCKEARRQLEIQVELLKMRLKND